MMHLKMTKRRGAKFKRPPAQKNPKTPSHHHHHCHEKPSGPLEYSNDDNSKPMRDSAPNLVECSFGNLIAPGWFRFEIVVIFIVKCFVLSIFLLQLNPPPTCYCLHNDGSKIIVTPPDSQQKQKSILPEIVNPTKHHHTLDIKQLQPQAAESFQISRNRSEVSPVNSNHPLKPVERETRASSSADRDDETPDDARHKNYARTSKQLRKLLARPRHILSSFVPHALTKQLVIKRPNNLMATLKLRRLHDKFKNTNQNYHHHGNNDKSISTGDSKRLLQHHPLSSPNHNNLEMRPIGGLPAIRPLGGPQIGEPPKFPPLPAPTLGTLQVRPLILTPTKVASHVDSNDNNHHHHDQMDGAGSGNKLLQRPFRVETPGGHGRMPADAGNDDRLANTERELDHIDQLIKSEYEKRVKNINTHEDTLSVDDGDRRNGSNEAMRPLNPALEDSGPSSSMAQADVADDGDDVFVAGRHWPTSGEHHSSFRYRGPTNGGGSGGGGDLTGEGMDSYDDNTMDDYRQRHSLRNQLSTRLATGTSNPKPIVQLLAQQQQQQQAFMPTALETIAQLRLNTHVNNGNNNYNNNDNNSSSTTHQAHSGDPLTNGTKSLLPSHHHLKISNPQYHQQAAVYLKVPSSQISSAYPPVIPRASKPSPSSSSLASHNQFPPPIQSDPIADRQRLMQQSSRQQNLQPHQLDRDFPRSHQNSYRPGHGQQPDGNMPSYSDDGGRAYLAPPTSGFNSHHHHEKLKRLNGQKLPDSIEQIISSMTAPSTSNNHGDVESGHNDNDGDGDLSNHHRHPQNNRKDHGLAHNHEQSAAAAGVSESIGIVNTGDNSDNDGHSIELSETLRKLRETKARIRQLQAELNVGDPSLLLLSPTAPPMFETTNHSVAGAIPVKRDDVWDEVGKYDGGGHDPGARASTSGSDRKLQQQQTVTSSSSPPPDNANNNHHQRKDWFRLWPRNSSIGDGSNNQSQLVKHFANRSSLLKETSMANIGAHESVNLPLGMYHSGPLGASARLVASAFGRAAKNTAPLSSSGSPQMVPGSHQVSMFSRPHVARVYGSAPVLLSSTMLVGDNSNGVEPIDLHNTQRPPSGVNLEGIDTSSAMASPELGNGDRLLNNINTFKEATIGLRLGSQFRPISQLGGEPIQKSDGGGGQLQVSAGFDQASTGVFSAQHPAATAAAAASADTQAVVSHNGFQPMNHTMNPANQKLMDMTTMTVTKGLSSSPATNESFNTNNSSSSSSIRGNNNNNHQNNNHNKDKPSTLILDANHRGTSQVAGAAARYPNQQQQLSLVDLLKGDGGNNTATIDLQQQRLRQLRDPSQVAGLDSVVGGGQQLATFERKQQASQANGSPATIGSSISSRIAATTTNGNGRNFGQAATAHSHKQQVDDDDSDHDGSASNNLNGLLANGKQHRHSQFSDSFDQESVNSINRLLANGQPAPSQTAATTTTSYATDSSGHQRTGGGRITSDSASKALNATGSGNSIGQLFSKLFQGLTFSSYPSSSSSSSSSAPGLMVAQSNASGNNNRQLLQQQQQSSGSPVAGSAIGGVTMVENNRLTTEKVLHTLIAFSCSLALLCLFVVVATVRCQMRVRKRTEGSQAALSIRSGEAGPGSSSSGGPLVGPTTTTTTTSRVGGLAGWRRGFGIGIGNGDGQRKLADKKGDMLILDGTMRNVSMLARHQNTDSNKISQELRKPPNLPLPLFKRTCCHCVSCSESWLFRDSSKASASSSSSSSSSSKPNNQKSGHTNLCSSGFYHPVPRGRLPFGAASSVNKLLNQNQPAPRQQGPPVGGITAQTGTHTNMTTNPTATMEAEMLKSPSVRGPIGGTRLRMMSAIEERASPEPGSTRRESTRGRINGPPVDPEPECICGQCFQSGSPSNQAQKQSCDSGGARQSSDLPRGGGLNSQRVENCGDTMEHHHCSHLLLEATGGGGAGDCEGCNCHGGGGGGNNVADQRPLPAASNPPPNCSVNYATNNLDADGEPISVEQQVEMSLNDDGLMVGPRSMEPSNRRELVLIESSRDAVAQQQPQHQRQQATTSAKDTITTTTITTNCESCIAGGSSGGGGGLHCCQLRAKHANLGLLNGSCCELRGEGASDDDDDGGEQVAISRAAAADKDNNNNNNNNNATIDRARTSAKSVLSPVNVKLRKTNTNQREFLPASDDGGEMIDSDNHQEATGCLQEEDSRHKQQLVRARVNQFNGGGNRLPDSRRQQAGQDEPDATCCPHDSAAASSEACEPSDRNNHGPIGEDERSRRRRRRGAGATTARIAALATSPLSLAATIQGKLRKTMATGASNNLNMLDAYDASIAGKQQLVEAAASSKGVSGQRKQPPPPNRNNQELRIEVEPANKFNISDGPSRQDGKRLRN